MKITSGVYVIVHKATQRAYVGSSCKIENRFIGHKRHLRKNRHHARHLQYAWNKYGEKAFEFLIIQEVNPVREALCEAEQKEMDKRKSYNNCYGFNELPRAYSRIGAKASKLTCQRIAIANKRRMNSPEGRKQIARMVHLAFSKPEYVKAMKEAIQKESQSIAGRLRRSKLCKKMWRKGGALYISPEKRSKEMKRRYNCTKRAKRLKARNKQRR